MNLHDVAREAGVSIATVSRVLNDSAAVRPFTKARVLDVVSRSGYRPNALARGLITRRTRTVGVLTVDILNPYYATVVHSVERRLSALGYTTLLCNTGGEPAEIDRYLMDLVERRVDAVVLVGSVYRDREDAERIRRVADRIPIVLVNNRLNHPNVYSLLCDDRAGIRLAVSHVVEGGRRRLLLINTRETLSARIKEKAFRSEAAARGIGSVTVIETGIEELGGLPARVAAAVYRRRFDAVVATDDLFANIAVNTLHSLRFEIPADIWVVGYNNSYVSEHTYPRLTSVDSRMDDLGAACAAVVDQRLSNLASPPRRQVLQPRLVTKESTGLVNAN